MVVTGSVTLAGTNITVQSNGEAALKLTCTGTETCTGKLTLAIKKDGTKKHSKMETIGATAFSIAAGKTVSIKLKIRLDVRGSS